MKREMMKSKIHRATVTHADLHYVGSITIDHALMKLSNILPGEKVDVVNVSNGSRLSTYAISGEPGSGVIGINGAAAHLVKPSDVVIIIAYAYIDDAEISDFSQSVVFVDAENRPLVAGSDPLAIHESAGDRVVVPPFALNSPGGQR